MSPEFKLINNRIIEEIDFNPEKFDIFSLGILYLRLMMKYLHTFKIYLVQMM